ncbi:AraC family transcriptional regulator [Chitinophaga sp. MM2321]|uniref:AraC family transcriptional regulator n=1 Tax=Chitinophaga sp. MM2321 TaxID=3137178 RepID=UPI0032D59E40
MKARLHKLPLKSDASFLYEKWECDYFDKPWHFHEEYELTLIEESIGTKFIGDKVGRFESGELMLIGSNIPHLFRNDEPYYNGHKLLKARSVFIHFTDDFMGTNFFDLPEMKLVRKLLQKSALGLQVCGNTNQYIRNKLLKMEAEKPARRIVTLLDILIRLSESRELRPMLSTSFVAEHSRTLRTKETAQDTAKINSVFEFIMKNFSRQIYLEEVAAMLSMSASSFSRYFKHHTLKTFSTYVTVVRITHACSLLMQDNDNISQIGYASGFENLSNFYRHFKRITGLLPKDYRERFLKSRM